MNGLITKENGPELRTRYEHAIAGFALSSIAGADLMSSALRTFSYFNDPIRMVSDLARLAEPCCWDRPADLIEGYPGQRLGYLYAVLNMAFCYAAQHQLVECDATFEHAVFNTGLKTAAEGESIYACFGLNRLFDNRPYRFAAFSPDPRKALRLGKQEKGFSLPAGPCFPRIEPQRKDVLIDGKHIARDRVYRIPERALDAVCGVDACSVIKGIEALKELDAAPFSPQREAAKEVVRCRAKRSAGFMARLRPALSDAIHDAVDRWYDDPGIAAGSYNPRGDRLLTLLPLHLMGSERPDMAVMLRDDGRAYRAITILELDRARAGALMVDRNLPTWLCAA